MAPPTMGPMVGPGKGEKAVSHRSYTYSPPTTANAYPTIAVPRD